MKTKSLFLAKARKLNKVYSKTRKVSYSNFTFTGNTLSFKRDSTGNYHSINLDELYTAYTKEKFINTIVLRNYISKWVYSPALAILIAMQFCDINGNRLN